MPWPSRFAAALPVTFGPGSFKVGDEVLRPRRHGRGRGRDQSAFAPIFDRVAGRSVGRRHLPHRQERTVSACRSVALFSGRPIARTSPSPAPPGQRRHRWIRGNRGNPTPVGVAAISRGLSAAATPPVTVTTQLSTPVGVAAISRGLERGDTPGDRHNTLDPGRGRSH